MAHSDVVKIRIKLMGRRFRVDLAKLVDSQYWRGNIYEGFRDIGPRQWVLTKEIRSAEGMYGAITVAIDMIADECRITP